MTAQALLQHVDKGNPWQAEFQKALSPDVAQAYQTALAMRRLRLARGERPRGFKIGFTNRTIWPVYQVFGPIWGTVYDSTLTLVQAEREDEVKLDASRFCQPRLEPETVFGMRRTPPVDANVDQLFECLDWVAPGFEIVQSHAPAWKFNAAMTVADGGLHGHLLVGRPLALNTVAQSAAEFNALFAACKVTLFKNGQAADQGQGANVLDGPLLALHHFLNELRICPGAPDLLPGDVVTTGTWTDAWPIQSGETWRAEFGAPLGVFSASFH